MKDWKLVLAGGGIALAGMVVGASLFGAEHAAAQHTYTRCFFAEQETVDVNHSGDVDLPDAAHWIDVPVGWDVVGGGLAYHASGTGNGGILLCH